MANASESRKPDDLPALGKYRLEQPIGEGGMGIVYSALDTTLQRRVAIKMLSQALAADTVALNRFLREAQAAGRLNHRNVVSIYEVARRGTTYFIVMELVPGGNLAERLAAAGALPWREATRIAADVCRGLVAAHAAGLVHRDVKPANFMLDAEHHVKLADFGLSKVVDQRGLTLTMANQTCGTPAYMSPEQCRFDEVNELSDIYSLGASYFALLVGHAPFAGELPVQVMFAHCSSPCPDPCRLNANIPAACGAIVQRAMAKSPADRYGSAAEMLAALERVHEERAEPPLAVQIRATPVPVVRGATRRTTARS
ncbi:MAG: serine/threonine-protein kinase, partial [Planctomycetota bacterium]